jgi:hypothetical protein
MLRRFLRWIGWLDEPLTGDIEDYMRDIVPLDTPFLRSLKRK